MERKTGTREWSGSSLNILKGCSHGCKYCYAKAMASRFGRIPGTWTDEVVVQKTVDQKYNKRGPTKQPIMFPTTHGITPENVSLYNEVLWKILRAGNQVLIVSKPHLKCIKSIHFVLISGGFHSQVEFRFTIGSANNDILKFWEPYAPSLEERLECLKFIHGSGYRTSVSCEPMLDDWIDEVVDLVRPYCSEIWLGKMNKVIQRLTQNKVDDVTMVMGKQLMETQRDEAIWKLYEKYKNDPIIKWKDSIKEVITNGNSAECFCGGV